MRIEKQKFVKARAKAGEQPRVGWLDENEAPNLRISVNDTIEAARARVPSLRGKQVEIGVLLEEWDGHGQYALVVSTSKNLGDGQEFAVTLESAYMRIRYTDLLNSYPDFRDRLFEALRDDNCASFCGIEAIGNDLYLKCPETKAGVLVRAWQFNQPEMVAWILGVLHTTLA